MAQQEIDAPDAYFEDICSDWEDYFAKITKSTILWSLDHGYLNFNGKPIYLHNVNRISLLFFKTAIESRRDALLVYPSSKPNITPLLSLEALYGRIYERDRPNLLVISDRLELRDEIKTYLMSFRVNSLSLHNNFFPVGAITKSGKIFDVTKAKKPPRVLISASPTILPDKSISNKLFGVLAEVSSTYNIELIDTLAEWVHNSGIPFVFYVTADPPSDAVLKLMSAGVPYWGWDKASLENDCRKDRQNASIRPSNIQSVFCNNFKEIENRSAGVKRLIIPVKEAKLNQFLKNARENYCVMRKTAKSENFAPAFVALRRYLGIVYSLEELTAPLSYSEQEFSRCWGMRTVIDRLDALELGNPQLDQWNPTFTSYYSKSIRELRSLYDYMHEHASGKPSVVLQAICEAENRSSAFVLISKNYASNTALLAFLHDKKGMCQEDLEKRKIFIRAADEAKSMPRVDTSMIYGSPRYYQRHLLELSFAKRLGILSYESEISSIRYLERCFDKNQELFSVSSRLKSLSSIKGDSGITVKSEKNKEKDLEKRRDSKIIAIAPLDAETDEKDYGSIFSDFLSQDFGIEYDESNEAARVCERRTFGGNAANECVEAVRLELSGGKCIFIEADREVQIYEDFNDKIKEKTARTLKNNEILVIINSSTSQSLIEEIIAKVEGHPKMTEVVFYQKLWILLLRQGVVESGDKLTDVVRKLHERGAKSPKTPMAVYFWMKGRVIGPNENENIRRIGEIYGKKMLVDNHEEIIAAIQRLREIHQSLSRKLRWLIPRAGVASETGSAEDIIVDEELNLYLEDFANTISMERILSVSGPTTVNVCMVDKVFPGGVELSHE